MLKHCLGNGGQRGEWQDFEVSNTTSALGMLLFLDP